MQSCALRELLGEEAKLFATPGTVPPNQTNFSQRLFAEQRPSDKIGAHQQARINGKDGQQSGPESVIDHLDQRRKARRFKALGETPVSEMACRESMIPQ